MKLLVLDYDGVILNSLNEKFFTGFNTYITLNPNTSLLDQAPITFDNLNQTIVNHQAIFKQFADLISFIGLAGENALAFQLIENQTLPHNLNEFVKLINKETVSNYYEHNELLVNLREDYGKTNQKAYLNLCPGYPDIVDIIQKLEGKILIEVLTTKTYETTVFFNDCLGITSAIKKVNVAGNQNHKVDTLIKMHCKYNIEKSEIIFVDDFLRHLVFPKKEGFTCYYANWGFGAEWEGREAKQAGISTINQYDFIKIFSKYL